MSGQQQSKTWLWVALAAGVGSCGLCTLSAGVALGAIALPSRSTAAPSGFAPRPPPPFKETSPGRFLHQWHEDGGRYSVEAIHLPTMPSGDTATSAVSQRARRAGAAGGVEDAFVTRAGTRATAAVASAPRCAPRRSGESAP